MRTTEPVGEVIALTFANIGETLTQSQLADKRESYLLADMMKPQQNLCLGRVFAEAAIL